MSARFQISAMAIARIYPEVMYVNVRKEAAAMQAFQMAASIRKHRIVHLIQVYIWSLSSKFLEKKFNFFYNYVLLS